MVNSVVFTDRTCSREVVKREVIVPRDSTGT